MVLLLVGRVVLEVLGEVVVVEGEVGVSIRNINMGIMGEGLMRGVRGEVRGGRGRGSWSIEVSLLLI